MNNREPLNAKSLVFSVLSLIVGIILCFNSDVVFEIIGYAISGILVLYGFIRLVMYITAQRKNIPGGIHLTAGIFLIILGLIIASFPKAIPVTLSIIIGGLIILNGIKRLILGLAIRQLDGQGSKFFVLVSFCMMLLGVIIITQMFLPLLGIFIIIYSLSDIGGYVYYKSQKKDYSEVFVNKSIPTEFKEKEAVDAVIDEE